MMKLHPVDPGRSLALLGALLIASLLVVELPFAGSASAIFVVSFSLAGALAFVGGRSIHLRALASLAELIAVAVMVFALSSLVDERHRALDLLAAVLLLDRGITLTFWVRAVRRARRLRRTS